MTKIEIGAVVKLLKPSWLPLWLARWLDPNYGKEGTVTDIDGSNLLGDIYSVVFENESATEYFEDELVYVRECDHDWVTVDDSFDHEFGTEVVIYQRCTICNKEQDYEHSIPDEW